MSLLTTQTRKAHIYYFVRITNKWYTFNCLGVRVFRNANDCYPKKKMSQVQVRQVPYATSTDAQRVVGSWVRDKRRKQGT